MGDDSTIANDFETSDRAAAEKDFALKDHHEVESKNENKDSTCLALTGTILVSFLAVSKS